MDHVFAVAPIGMLAIFAIFATLTYLVSVGFLFFFGRGGPVAPQSLPVPNFAATITTAWALALGFAAADIWAANGRAQQAAHEERSAISRIAGIAAPEALGQPAMIDSLRAYKAAVELQEWGRDLNREPAEDVDRAIHSIRLNLVELAIDGVPPSLIAKITDDFDQLQDARSMRLAIGSAPISHYRWYLVLFLTVLSQVALASVHADRPKGGRSALAIFTVAASVSLWILALHANPYVGVAKIKFEDIRGWPIEAPG